MATMTTVDANSTIENTLTAPLVDNKEGSIELLVSETTSATNGLNTIEGLIGAEEINITNQMTSNMDN